MTEFKTLKDLGREYVSATGREPLERVDVKDLKAEAVKWVKFYDREAEPARANAIMDFFNITEEDLK